ncbi:hypothetical protein SRABI13_01679 [Erwinia aphidicola]|uniref:Acb2/Tad1 domain-containing protein n=1 Tax=Erwinia aphidicola TaxID=68334 RepID=UPI001D334AE1|nr:hypothetical protein [Erwinia aphidicola]CAH0198976.1 hypothetical protein SRABI13_01679 [Erwinia aphidicola]
MSEAKPQDGSTVKGYRTLSHGEIGKMNQFKELSRQFHDLLRQHGEDLAKEQMSMSDDEGFEAFEWMREVRHTMQKATMFACRSVTRPDSDC